MPNIPARASSRPNIPAIFINPYGRVKCVILPRNSPGHLPRRGKVIVRITQTIHGWTKGDLFETDWDHAIPRAVLNTQLTNWRRIPPCF